VRDLGQRLADLDEPLPTPRRVAQLFCGKSHLLSTPNTTPKAFANSSSGSERSDNPG
jgi:hypothetical protein